MRSDTTPAAPRDLPLVWSQTCDRISGLLAGLAEADTEVIAPTLDAATVRDIVAHLVGIATDDADDPDVAFRLPAAANGSRRLGELMSAWAAATEVAHDRVGHDPVVTARLITAVVMCEQDLRTALDVPGARDDVAVKVALDELSGRLSDRVAAAKLPPLRVTVEQWGTIVGDGRATVCVVADRFEFVRAMSGRRSAAQIRRWNWGVDPAAYLAVIAETDLPTSEVRERDPRVPAHMRDREFVL